MRYVVIGSGIAGISAAKTIRQHDSDGEITVLTNEVHPFGLYARKDLAQRLVQGAYRAESLLLEGEAALKGQGITLEYVAVERIFPHLNQVLKDHGIRQIYDRLLLATGATPRLVDAPGLHYLGVHQVRHYEDISWIEAWMGDLQQVGAVVIGGGILALDLAYALRQRGVPVTLVVREAHVGAPLLSETAGRLIEQRLQRDGIRLLLGRSLTAYRSDDERVLDSVQLDDGQIIAARMALCAIGVHPNTGFLENTGVEIDAETGTIVVNSMLQTSIPNVYAAGNCALVDGMISRTWSQAEEQGRIAGLSMVGQAAYYRPVYVGDLNTKFYDLPFAYFGRTIPAENDQVWTWAEDSDHFAQVLLAEGTIAGAVLLGDACAQAQTLLDRCTSQSPASLEDLEALTARSAFT